MKFTEKKAKTLGKKYNINFKIVPIKEWEEGLDEELEHGSRYGSLTNVTKDDPDITARIVLAHLLEDPRYYFYLEKIEHKRKKYWNPITKPSIFSPSRKSKKKTTKKIK